MSFGTSLSGSDGMGGGPRPRLSVRSVEGCRGRGSMAEETQIVGLALLGRQRLPTSSLSCDRERVQSGQAWAWLICVALQDHTKSSTEGRFVSRRPVKVADVGSMDGVMKNCGGCGEAMFCRRRRTWCTDACRRRFMRRRRSDENRAVRKLLGVKRRAWGSVAHCD